MGEVAATLRELSDLHVQARLTFLSNLPPSIPSEAVNLS
jgi:hypothetical protein